MKILLIMDPGIPIPPPLYGGHERLVYMFAHEYKSLGHDVSLLAGPDSLIEDVKVFSFGVNDLNRTRFQKLRELFYVWKYLFNNAKQFDIIHNFGRLAYLLPVLNLPSTKIMSYGRAVSKKGICFFNKLPNKQVIYTACSDYCVSTGNVAGNWKTVYNAIDFSKYALQTKIEDDAPLMFLGRMDKEKGLQTAIKLAKETNNKLLIGGSKPSTQENIRHFEEVIEKQFDNEQIIYLGPLNDEQKSYYLGKSKALLFPIEWDEPFGMVMVEAMACGTPVIACPRGSVPEVIDLNITGFYSDSYIDMVNAIENISQFDREKVRDKANQRFSANVIAKKYLSLLK